MGFSLIELLVTISIIAILVSILSAALGKIHAVQERVLCLSNLRQLAEATMMYASDHDGYAPDEESQYTWDALIQAYIPDERVYACPTDLKGMYDEIGTSYEIRDSFAVDADHPERSFLNKRLLEARPSSLVLLFELSEGWHESEHRNAVTVDGAARMFSSEEFTQNLKLTVSQ
jgi:prepilin-type N-terminal cleavage/methylation domain-containing protein